MEYRGAEIYKFFRTKGNCNMHHLVRAGGRTWPKLMSQSLHFQRLPSSKLIIISRTTCEADEVHTSGKQKDIPRTHDRWQLHPTLPIGDLTSIVQFSFDNNSTQSVGLLVVNFRVYRFFASQQWLKFPLNQSSCNSEHGHGTYTLPFEQPTFLLTSMTLSCKDCVLSPPLFRVVVIDTATVWSWAVIILRRDSVSMV